MGSVYKLSGNRRRPWVARITTGWELEEEKQSAKQKYQVLGYFETEEEANKALLENQINPVSPKANITLEQLYLEWSKNKYENISKQTADNYRAAWNYMQKYRNTHFKELRAGHFQSIINACHKEGKSKSTMKKIKVLAGLLYGYAMQNDITNKNYAEFITIPKVDTEEKTIFTDLEIKKLEENANTIEWADTILIMIYSGMRISEMLSLTKFNVDLDNQIITGGVKTDAGKNRIIPIHPKIFKYIKRWYDKNGDYLICSEDRKEISASAYRKSRYYPCLERLQIRKLTPHICRHTFASLMSRAGANTKAIQKIIGHSNYALTANVYTHTDVEELKKAISMI